MGQKVIRQPHTEELELLVNVGVEHAKDAGLTQHDCLERNHFKKQLRQIMISPDYKIFVYEQNGVFAGYVVAGVFQKLWNPTLHGEIVLFFVHPEVRNKYIADDLLNTALNWFAECGCQYYQASCLMYDADYQPNQEWLHRSRTYFAKAGMAEVGYHFVQNLENFR